MKVLITGASGYVGSKIYKDLKENGYEAIGLYNNNKLFDDLVNKSPTGFRILSFNEPYNF